MSPARLFQLFALRLLPLLVLGLVGARAMAQADPPSRVARVNQAEGTVVFSQAGDNEWVDAVLNRPLTRGDRIWTDRGSRAEVQVGSSAVRLDGLTHVEILALDDRAAQLSVTQGSVYVRIRSLPEGEDFEIDTPNLAYRAAYPGDYRIDVDAARGTTRVTIHSGTGAVYGEAGQVLPLGSGQQITFRARTLTQVAVQESPPQDNFDRWATDRNRREDQSVSARYVPREVVGYQQLDAYGQWTQDAAYGSVWIPQGTPANWAPYRNGHWEWMSPWGWTWIDDASWGFAPFHYGRWAMIGSRWAWVPGRLGLKPVYAPALVAFVGGGSAGVSWNIALGAGRPGVAWFPLGPGEVWQPGYRASPVYMGNLNQNLVLQANPTYANQRRPEALTSISAEDFHRGKPVRAGWLRIAANTLTSAQIVPPPPMPERGGVIDRQRSATALRVAAPAQPAATTTPASAKSIADAAAMRQAEATQHEAAQRQAAAAAQSRTQALALAQAAQAHARAQALAQQQADVQRVLQAVTQQRARAEQAKREQQAKAAPAPKPAEPVTQIARLAEQARREQLTRRAAQQREKVAKQAEEAKREAVARREEQLRREVHAQHVEQARRTAERDAQALREQRAQREELQARRDAQEREQAQQREQAQRAAARQQALAEQWQRDQQAWEEQQQQQRQQRTRSRPDLRDDRRSRGIPILNSEPMS